jgi:hypothetical protein
MRSPHVAGIALFLVAAAAMIGGYAWYALRRIEVFGARDLRGLSTLAAQIESEIDRQSETVVDFAANHDEPLDRSKINPDLYDDFFALDRETPAKTTVAGQEIALTLSKVAPRPHLEIHAIVPMPDRSTRGARGAVALDTYVHPLFDQSFLNIFDSVLLATADGTVLAQTPTMPPPPLPPLFHDRRRDAASVRLTEGIAIRHLGALERHDGSTLNVADLRGVSRRTEVRIDGTEFYLFTQPLRLHVENEPTAKDPAGFDLLVGALVTKAKFRRHALTISDSTILLSIALLVLLLCWYPFVRIVELPRGAPLRAVDVVLAALATLIGVAVVAMAISDFITYRRLRGFEDLALTKYGQNLRRDLLKDVLRATVAAEALCDLTVTKTTSSDDFANNDLNWRYKKELFQQPYFEGFVWADADGKATITAAARGPAPPLTSVRRRRFFADAKSGNWSTVVETRNQMTIPHQYAVEIVATRDDPQTIVAVPSHTNDGRVFAAFVRFIHFVDPVVPPGYGFAVIDDQGMVQFHSDKHRALHENLFRETEDDRQLRAAVFARRDAWVDARYWGNDHQLYVAPVPGTNWTVVAMRDESLVRSVNSEIIALTALLLALYAAVYAIGFVLLTAFRPRYRAPWLWPNTRGAGAYLVALFALIIELAAFAACILLLDSWEVMYVAFLAPIRGLCTAFVIVTTDREDEKQRWIGIIISTVATALWVTVVRQAPLAPVVAEQWSRNVVVYMILAAVFAPWFMTFLPARPRRLSRYATFVLYKCVGGLLVLTIAVLPALGFLQVATRLGTEGRVKYSQILLADALERRLNLLERINMRDARIGFDCYGIEYVFDSAWTVIPRATTPRPDAFSPRPAPRDAKEQTIWPACKPEAVQPPWFPDALAALLPHYSENSVALRNLGYDNASDLTWRWCRQKDLLIFEKRVKLDPLTAARFYGKRTPATDLMIVTALPPVTHQQRLFAPAARPTAADMQRLSQCTTSSDSLVGEPAETTAITAHRLAERTRVEENPRPHVYAFIKWLGGATACVLFFFYLPLVAVAFFGRHVFLYREQAREWVAGDPDSAGSNVFVVDPEPPPAGLPGALDLDSVLTRPRAAALLRQSTDAGPATDDLLISDFATPFFESPSRLLDFLESTIDAKRKRVVIHSTVSPATVLTMVPEASRPRWESLFANFAVVDPGLLAGRVPRLLLPGNRFVFERIWSESSAVERLVLYQIARDGLVNEKCGPILHRLMVRGLVRRSPEIHLASSGLERFVLSAGKKENVAEAELESKPPGWSSLRFALALLIIVGVIVMLTSQKEVLNYTSGIITAIAAAVPALLRLIAVVTGRSPEEPS